MWSSSHCFVCLPPHKQRSPWYLRNALVYVSCRDRDLINKCGEDARIYIMFQYHLIIFVLILCIPSLGIILPINYIGSALGRQDSAGCWHGAACNLVE